MMRPAVVWAVVALGILAAGNAPAGDRVLDAFLRATYGPKASSTTPWVVQAKGNDHPAIYREACASQRSGEHAWLAVCTSTHPVPHAGTGGIDFFALRESGGRWVVESSLKDFASGSFGIPGTVVVQALGHGVSGFRVEEAWFGQGQVIGTQSLLAPRGGTFVSVATFRKGLDNSSMFKDGESARNVKAKIELTFDLSVDATGRGALYPLEVRERGVECGHIAKRTWKLIFDPVRGRYPIPKALMREECLQSADAPGAMPK